MFKKVPISFSHFTGALRQTSGNPFGLVEREGNISTDFHKQYSSEISGTGACENDIIGLLGFAGLNQRIYCSMQTAQWSRGSIFDNKSLLACKNPEIPFVFDLKGGFGVKKLRDNDIKLRDNAELARDNSSISRDNARLTRDKITLALDNVTIAQDSVRLSRAKSSLSSDNAIIARDKVKIARDNISQARRFL